MSFFNTNQPLLSRKQITVDTQTMPGIWQVHWRIGHITLYSTVYTRLDQACLLWGLISAVIFMTAQFIPLNWTWQALLWSGLTLIGTVSMVILTWVQVTRERLTWLLYSWVGLMVAGLLLTDLSIFLGWGEVLINLCPLWLALVAVCYLLTGLGMRSRAFLVTALVHLLGILILPYVGAWQFLATGIVMGLSVVVLAEFRWDMGYQWNYSYTNRSALQDGSA